VLELDDRAGIQFASRRGLGSAQRDFGIPWRAETDFHDLGLDGRSGGYHGALQLWQALALHLAPELCALSATQVIFEHLPGREQRVGLLELFFLLGLDLGG